MPEDLTIAPPILAPPAAQPPMNLNEHPNTPPRRVFSGTLSTTRRTPGGVLIQGSGGSHGISVKCWEEKFYVSVSIPGRLSERWFPAAQWTHVAGHLNHRYSTNLPVENYPGSEEFVEEYSDLFPTGPEMSGSIRLGTAPEPPPQPPPVRPPDPPARRVFKRLIED
jgi:hypothetical protein